MEAYEYDAFISYSHRDLKWARWLQGKLETLRIPAEADEAFANRRRMKVFRDQTDLNGVEVTESLHRELTASRYLVVVCSPSSAASRWVDDEVAFFTGLGRRDRIVAFIIEGEPDSDTPELECYPPGLRCTGERHLLGANVQEIGRNKAYLKVASLLIGVRFNRLVDREKQRRRRAILTATAAVLVISASTAALLWRNATISRQNKELVYDGYGTALVSFAQNEVIKPEELATIEDSARAGNAYAALLLGDCYSKGWGTQKDDVKAFEWYRRAAEGGNVVGMVALANCYIFGNGTEVNPEEAFAWNMRSAELGSAEGMLNVALDYEGGHGTEPDPKAAFEWYKKSAKKGYDLAMYNLSRCYRSGIGTKANPKRAFFWMKRLAQTDNAEAMYNLGMMYQLGYGTAEDPQAAYAWYRKAADSGDGDALYMTGWCIENRYGIDNPALEWYEKAAEAGNADAAKAVERLEGPGQSS